MNIYNRAEEILNEYRKVVTDLNNDDLLKLAENIIKTEKTFILAAGRSKCVAQMFAMRLAQSGLNVYVAGDVTTPAITKNDLLLVISGSGKTRSVLAMAENASQSKVELNAITATTDTRLTQLSDYSLILPTANKKNTQVLGNFFETCLLLTCDLLIEIIMNKTFQTPNDLANRHANVE